SLELGYLCSRSVDLAREHLGTLLDLGIRLGLADTRKRYANQRQYCWIGTLYSGSQVLGAWPLGQVYRSGAPPAPYLFGCERQERCEEAQYRIQGRCQGCQYRSLFGLAMATVGAVLDQLSVVIGERPEERLGDIQRTGVVVVIEGALGIFDHRRQAS